MRIKSILFAASLSAGIVGLGIGPSFAQEFVAGGSYSNGLLTIAGPDGFNASVFSRHGVPALSSFRGLPDGEYTYQLTAASNRTTRSASALDNGRGSTANVVREGAAASGTFNVVRGAILMPASPASDGDDRD